MTADTRSALEIAVAFITRVAKAVGCGYDPGAREALAAMRAAPGLADDAIVEWAAKEWPEQYKPDHWNEQERGERPRIIMRRVLKAIDAYQREKAGLK